MRIIDSGFITGTAQQPFTEGTWEHLQLAYYETIQAIAKNLTGILDNANIYRLWGLVNTGVYPAYNVTQGAVYYAGEIYLVDAFSFTATGSNRAVGNVVVTQFTTNADPLLFTDGSTHNVHNIRKIAFTDLISGSGINDFEIIKETSIGLKTDFEDDLPASYIVKFDQDKAVFFNTAPVDCIIGFDFTNAVPGCVVRVKWSFGAGRALSVVAAGGQTIIKDSGNLAAVSSSDNLLYFLYVGKNIAGNDEVSYTLKQY